MAKAYTAEENLRVACLLALTREAMLAMLEFDEIGKKYGWNRRKKRRRWFNRRLREVREMYQFLVEIDGMSYP